MMKNSPLLVSCGLAVLALAILSACSTQTAPAPAATNKAAGAGAWTDFTLFVTSPDDLSPAQKQRFQNMAMGVTGVLAGADFVNGTTPGSIQWRNDLQLRGVLMRESWHRDGMAIWKLEGQVLFPARAKTAKVWQTKVIELSTSDPELTPRSFVKDYPANLPLSTAINRAVHQVLEDGVTKGKARVASMQYDSDKGRFRVRVEILGAD